MSAFTKNLEADATEIRLRAERRLGEMMDEGKPDRAAVGGDRRVNDGVSKTPSLTRPSKPTLIEVGRRGQGHHRHGDRDGVLRAAGKEQEPGSGRH